MTRRSVARTALWLIDADHALVDHDALWRTLDQSTCARAERFLRPQDRRRFIVFQAALREVLGAALGKPPECVAFETAAHGKPAISPAEPELAFNLSHSGGIGVLAVTDGVPVGVDIEQHRTIDRADRFAARFLGPDERKAYDQIPDAQRSDALLRAWTRKEAYLKATGEGLSFPPECVSVTFAEGAGASLVSVAGRPQEASRWSLTDLVDAGGPAGLIGALAVEAFSSHIEWHTLWLEGEPLPRQLVSRHTSDMMQSSAC